MRFPPARFSSTHHGRTRHGHHAMPYDRRDAGNHPRVRGADAQGTTDFSDHPDPPFTPRYSARPASSGRIEDNNCSREGSRDSDAIGILAPRDSRRDNDPFPHHLPPRSSTPDQPYLATQTQPQEQSQDLVHRRRRHRRESIPRNGEPRSLPRPRDYEAAHPATYHSAPLRSTRRTPIESLDRRHSRSRSPSIRRQQRSWSPVADESQPKRPRRDPSLRRPNREPHTTRSVPYPSRSDRLSPPRDAVPIRRENRRPQKKKGHRASTPSLPPRGRSPSPRLESKFAENPNLVPLGQRPSSRHDLDPPPAPTYPLLSRSQQRTSPPLDRGRQSSKSYIDNSRRQTSEPALEEYSDSRPHVREASRNDHKELFPSKKREQDRFQSQVEPPELASGANSIEVNMSARGNFRGSHGGRHYNQGPHESRNYSQSSGHGTPNSSVQGSPPAGGRGNWNGQK